jgi:hypothetical protein
MKEAAGLKQQPKQQTARPAASFLNKVYCSDSLERQAQSETIGNSGCNQKGLVPQTEQREATGSGRRDGRLACRLLVKSDWRVGFGLNHVKDT